MIRACGLEDSVDPFRDTDKLTTVRMVELVHEHMSPTVEVDYVSGMRNLESVSPIPRWCLFTGSGIGSRMLEALSTVLKSRYGIDVVFDDVLMAEKHEGKQIWIEDQFDPSFLCPDVKDLVQVSAKNITMEDAPQTLIPYGMVGDGGITCTSRSSCNRNRSLNKDCVQQGREATGEAWQAVESAVVKHDTEVLLTECTNDLDKHGELPGITDAEFICERLMAHSFWVHKEEINPTDFGSRAPRPRLYWAAIRGLMAPHPTVTLFYRKVLNALKVSVPYLDFNAFLTFDLEQRQNEACYVVFHRTNFRTIQCCQWPDDRSL